VPDSGASSSQRSKSILTLRVKAAAERAATDKDTGVLFFSCETNATRPLPGIQSAHARALHESKVAQFCPYDCRHTWATCAADVGIDLVTLAAMPGHSRINMVPRYPSDARASDEGDGQDGAVCQRTEDCPRGANSGANVLRCSIGVEQKREKRGTRFIFRYGSLCSVTELISKQLK
jgi:hypothetical protein